MKLKFLWFKNVISSLLIAIISMFLFISCSTPSIQTKTSINESVNYCKAEDTITRAKIVIKEADLFGGLWKETEALLNSAKKASEAGQCSTALAYAQESYQKAQLGLNQAYEEHTKFRINQLEGSRPAIKAFEKHIIEKVREKLRRHQGKQAYELIKSIAFKLSNDRE